MTLVAVREVRNPNSVFRELGKPEQAFLKLPRLFWAMLHLLELFTIVNLVFESAFHDFFPDLFDAVYK